ncbi:MAG: hypothetical protein BMS9Abin14_575 [Gammaproteobacteria bacterium]|nr:MAG: hypothetical protein BMS9Abin14_575 [Gammaproteobacteria bacterium]
MKIIDAVDVGALDSELKSSPVVDAETEEGEFSATERDTKVCYFNGIRHPVGDYICSGDELLRCDNGVWVRSRSHHD